MPLVLDSLRYYAGYADKIHGSTIPIRGNHFTYTRREAVWRRGPNHPLELPDVDDRMEVGTPLWLLAAPS